MMDIHEQRPSVPELSTPHFDDEATLVSARRVVPITAARANDRRRLLRRALPFIGGAAMAGILIGIAVGYYAKHRNSEGAQQAATAREPESLAVSTQPSSSPQAEIPQTAQTGAPRDGEQAASTDSTRNLTVARPALHAAGHSRNLAVIKSRRTKRGAGHIQEIFAGANP